MRQQAHFVCAALAAGVIAAGGLAAPASAQLGNSAGDAGAFGGVRFPIQAADGVIDLAGRSGWLWREGTTHRVLLETEVRVVLGGDEFFADAVSLWLERLDGDRWQVFGVFRGVRADAGSIDIRAETLPVRGVVRIAEPVRVRVDARFDGPPGERSPAAGFDAMSRAVFASRVLGEPMPGEAAVVRDGVRPGRGPGADAPTPGQAVVREADPDAVAPVFRATGVFSFFVGDRIVIEGGGEGVDGSSGGLSTITATGGVVMQYSEPGSGRVLEMKAERAVVFLKDGPLDRTLSRLDAGQVQGVYLEGGVTGGDERFTVRSPRVYLDVERGRALMLDAVFWTTDARTGMPVYVRAEAVRQESERVFRAERARLSNSSFFEPDFFIGIRDLEVRLDEPRAADRAAGGEGGEGVAPDGQRVTVVGRNVTLNALGIPVFWLPGFKGDPDRFPLRQIRVTDSNREGFTLRTVWDLNSVLGADWPGVDLDLKLDYYDSRGFAMGVDGRWETAEHAGQMFSYLLPEDTGRDVLPAGVRIDQDGDTRGMFTAGDIWRFRDNWAVITELSYISDETFVPAFFRQFGKVTEEFRNRVILQRQGEQSQFTVEASAAQGDFIAAEHLLQTDGYRVERLPEARLVWGMRDVFEETLPGVLAYGFEARLGSLSLDFSDATGEDYGFLSAAQSNAAQGTLPTQSVGDVLRAAGLDEDPVTRLDSRHELVATLSAGPLRITPFLVGRVTAYDTDFGGFSPSQDEKTRLWGGAGVTVSTVLQRINNDAESRALDIHRVRHLVEPSVTVWTGDSNIDRSELPVFDDDVEDLLTGTMVRAAVDQTWQTKRGGMGRWRDADVFRLTTEYVWSSEGTGTSAIPRWYAARPELSNPGEFVGASAVWQPTEVVAIAGEGVYDLDANEFARVSGGVLLEHGAGLRTSLDFRRIEALDATYGSIAARYRLTEKYALTAVTTYNFTEDDFQNVSGFLQRRFQFGSLGVVFSYDTIIDETSLGVVFRPGSEGGLTIDPTYGG